MDDSAGTEAVAIERERERERDRDRKHVNENVKVVPPSRPERRKLEAEGGGQLKGLNEQGTDDADVDLTKWQLMVRMWR